MADEIVDDGEQVYRRVPSQSNLFSVKDGQLTFSSSAFNDRNEQPSVDRARLRKSPLESQEAPTDGVVSLPVAAIREIRDIDDPESGARYAIDVKYRPIFAGNPEGLPENLAHSQIEADPSFRTRSRFRKLKDALARLATEQGWLVEPS